MEHWGMNTMSKKVSMLALASAFTIGVAACGGGGGSDSPSSSGTVLGVAVEGPVVGGSVTVYNADGSKCSAASTSTGTDAKFSLSIGTCTPPLALELSGGTDAVHSTMGVTVPQTNMRSIIGVSTQTVANISPFSTLIYHSLIKDSASLSAAGITTSNANDKITTKATSIIKTFGFGVDLLTDGSSISAFNPITASLGSTNLATFIQASEALSETVRRVAKAGGGVNSTNIGLIFQYLGRDLSDDTLDGSMGSSAISSAISGFSMDSIRAYAQANALFILNEIFSTTGLSVTDSNGSQKSALSAIKTAIGTVSSSATTSFDNVKPNTNVTSQWTSAQAVALGLLGKSTLSDLGISSALSTSTSISSRGTLTVSTTEAANVADSSKVSTYSSNVAKANTAYVTSSTFNVALSSVTLTDYPSNTATTLTPSTRSISSGSLMITLASTTTVSASNLALLATSSATSASATPAVVNFTLSNMPQGSGTAGVTMTLLDGSDSTRTSGERFVSASFNMPWSSDGSTLTLTAPSSASVSYYAAADSSASSATLSQSAVGGLAITSSGSNQSSLKNTVKLQVAELFNASSKHGNASLASAMTSMQATGNYYYSIDFSGISLSGTDSSSNTSTFSQVKGTFSTK
ncbi:MAG: hypothetical protein HW380_2274 [Magnetococcales bacterium]|nr:hypothetical protein [Magnetococcales bacterium]